MYVNMLQARIFKSSSALKFDIIYEINKSEVVILFRVNLVKYG